MRVPGSFLFFVLCAALLLCATGCIRSRLIVTSEPPGATVYFQNQERGDTPITIPFIWYWYYEVRVEKEGYRSLRQLEHFPPPPWFIMPLDLIAELIPVPIIDNRRRHYTLEPLPSSAAAAPETTLAP